MPNDYRSITGLYRKFWTNEPLANATIIIQLLTNSFTLEAGYPTTKTPGVANDPGQAVQLDANGNLPENFKLFCSGKNIGGATKYRVFEPDGFFWDFILDYGDGTPISMQTLRAGGLPAPNSETVIALIEDKIAQSSIRFDIAQTLTGNQKHQAFQNLGLSVKESAAYWTGGLFPNDGDWGIWRDSNNPENVLFVFNSNGFLMTCAFF